MEDVKKITSRVLILVLVEDGLGGYNYRFFKNSYSGLNPCFSGGWSRRILKVYN